MKFADDKKSGRQTPDGSSSSNASNGAQTCRGPKGPDPNAYKKPQEIGSKLPNTENSGDFWLGFLKALRDGVAPIAHAIVDPDGTMIDPSYDRFGPGSGQVEQGGYKFGNALMVAEGVRGAGQLGGGIASKALGAEGKAVNGTVSLRSSGAAEGASQAGSTTRVGRWMSEAEYKAMVETGTVSAPFNGAGATHVTVPANSASFKPPSGSTRFVEFDVPTSQLRIHDTTNGWGRVFGPGSLEARAAQSKGLTVPTSMPSATNIKDMTP